MFLQAIMTQVLTDMSSIAQTLPNVAQALDQDLAFDAPTCGTGKTSTCTPSGIATTIASFCSRFVADGKSLEAGSQLSGDSYNFAEGFVLVATFTVRANGITLTRETCIETLSFLQGRCVVQPGPQCAPGQVSTTDGNVVASISFS
jgi:hypothetical protein